MDRTCYLRVSDLETGGTRRGHDRTQRGSPRPLARRHKPSRAMEVADFAYKPAKEFAKDSIRLIRKCTKPDKKEFSKVALRTGMGFIVMGFVGFFVKLILCVAVLARSPSSSSSSSPSSSSSSSSSSLARRVASSFLLVRRDRRARGGAEAGRPRA